MATFYIQLENKLLQISGELNTENISKALGYVPVSPNVTNELSQRVDNITFDSLKDNPFLQDGSGELNIVDEAGNIIAKIDADGIHSVDFIAGEHRLSDKTDKTYVDEAIKNVEVDLTGYATEEYVNNIDFYNIKDNPIANGEENSLTLVDENGNIGLKVSEDGLYVKDVIADGHTLSQKADKSDIPSLDGYATESWVENKGYAKEEDIPSLYGYATQQWVNEQEFAHQEDLLEISFNDIQDSPISIDDSSELNLIDENGNVGLKVNNEGLFVKDVIAGNHKLSDKADVIDIPTHTSQLINNSDFITKANVKSSIDEISSDIETIENIIEENEEIVSTALTDLNDRLSDVEENAVFSLNGIATEQWVNEKGYAKQSDLLNISFNSLKDSPITDTTDGEINVIDENGNVGLRVNNEGLFVKDVIADNHILSSKVDNNTLKEHIDEIKRNYTTKQESENMEYVLVLAITELETRVKELEAKLTNVNTALDEIIES